MLIRALLTTPLQILRKNNLDYQVIVKIDVDPDDNCHGTPKHEWVKACEMGSNDCVSIDDFYRYRSLLLNHLLICQSVIITPFDWPVSNHYTF